MIYLLLAVQLHSPLPIHTKPNHTVPVAIEQKLFVVPERQFKKGKKRNRIFKRRDL